MFINLRSLERNAVKNTIERDIIICDKVGKPSGPYSLGTRLSLSEVDLIFVSGAVSQDAQGNTVGKGDVVLQTEQALKNMQDVLEASGASLNDVVKVTVFLRNMEHRGAVAEVRKRFFKDNLPASTLVEVSKLAYEDLLVEIEAIAAVQR
jgi:2-iminobutanoate/2-iminopropanoate deaminase